MAETIAEFEINRREGTTVKEELERMTASVIDAVKAHLDSKAITNEGLLADIQQTIAGTEKIRAETLRTHAETSKIYFEALKSQYELLKLANDDIEKLDVEPVLETMTLLRGESG